MVKGPINSVPFDSVTVDLVGPLGGTLAGLYVCLFLFVVLLPPSLQAVSSSGNN